MDYPGKILLFGEYGILLNSKALSVPFSRFSGRFRFPDTSMGGSTEKETTSRAELNRLFSYLKSGVENFGFLDLEKFGDDLKLGLYFDSSIPSGSGLGSSGALTAAVYARYGRTEPTRDFSETRKYLALIEACFHGQSSGIDPLTSYYNNPVLLENTKTGFRIADLSLFLETFTLYLIHMHQKGNTGKQVGYFMEKCLEPGYRRRIDSEYLPLINQIIDAVVSEDFELFESILKKYAAFQLACFDRMIPEALKKHMDHGTKSNDFYIKLCGSGGGGYMLAITRNRQQTEQYFNSNQLDFSMVKPSEINNHVLIHP